MKIACGIWLGLTAWLAAAALDFPATLKEVDAPPDVESVTAEFAFTNHSGKPVDIAKYDPTCSCMVVEILDGKLHYAPGESGLVRAQFKMGNLTGTVDKMVAIWLDKDADDKPSVALTVRVHIPVLVALEPKTLKWELNGKDTPQTIHITMHHDQPIRVLSVTASTESFKQELKTVAEGKSYDLIVTPTDIKTPCLGIFRIETDCKIKRHQIQQVFATVRKSTPGEARPQP